MFIKHTEIVITSFKSSGVKLYFTPELLKLSRVFTNRWYRLKI